ncbi:glycoside hydrolase family 3 C-terminal domain-containing protein [Photobacterium sagamiensis]|uniref:glycoside hydrolase family 3 C-terminal domain-containing protein n=1 Tax=Photobacterium sagamiensis TaxID=2910241 RepID=UPI003D0D414F
MKDNIKGIVDQLTIEEKASLLTGQNFWETKAIDRLGIDSIMLTDGPHGLRKQEGDADHLGLNGSVTAVCFPTASAVACSFNEELAERMGKSLGSGARDEDVSVLLGPGNNIKRSPLCGRNFEYFSEDPLLSGKMASAMIKGIQSEGVGCSLKHFAVNNQEDHRMVVNAVVDERTLREIYLAAFEIPVKEAKPWTVMSSYNRINGVYASENSRLLNDILRDEWDFDGVVVSDWGAVDHLSAAVANGMDLEMPTSGEVGPKNVIKALEEKRITIEQIDTAVSNLIYLTVRGKNIEASPYSIDEAHDIAREVAEESIVLLKNEDNVLPMSDGKYKKIAVIGGFANTPRYQGSGSSKVSPYKVSTLLDSLRTECHSSEIEFAQGYSTNTDKVCETLIQQAEELSKNSDAVVLCIGLTDDYESEGFDRTHLDMPTNHLALAERVMKANSNVIVVLSNGSAVKIPFEKSCPAIVEGWLTGESGAEAMARILTGKANPSGRLAETFIRDESQDPSLGNFPGKNHEVVYEEGIFIGYRSHQKKNNDVQFPFGHGLSYTAFDYSNLQVTRESDLNYKVSVSVTNTGSVAGKEVVQLYVGEEFPILDRPIRELKRFAKVHLEPKESKTVIFNLDPRCFAFFNVSISDWCITSGDFLVEVGKSCEHIALSENIHVNISASLPKISAEKIFVNRQVFAKSIEINRNFTVSDLERHPVGKFLYKKIIAGAAGGDEGMASNDAMVQMAKELPLRNLVSFNGGKDMDEGTLDFIIKALNSTRHDKIFGKAVGLITRFIK